MFSKKYTNFLIVELGLRNNKIGQNPRIEVLIRRSAFPKDGKKIVEKNL
jgi:hypothetical protein